MTKVLVLLCALFALAGCGALPTVGTTSTTPASSLEVNGANLLMQLVSVKTQLTAGGQCSVQVPTPDTTACASLPLTTTPTEAVLQAAVQGCIVAGVTSDIYTLIKQYQTTICGAAAKGPVATVAAAPVVVAVPAAK